MKVALVVPGGMDPSGTENVIPCLLWLVRRLARAHDVHVFAMRGSPRPDRYRLEGATVHAVGPGRTGRTLPTVSAIAAEHREAPFALIHAFWASGPGVAAAMSGSVLRRPVLLHVTGGDTASLPEIGYGGRLGAAGRARVALSLRAAAWRTAPSGPLVAAVTALGHQAQPLPLGVDLERWPTAPPRPRDPALPLSLVHVGSLNRVKDQPMLLRTVRRLVDRGVPCTLDLVGADTLGGALQRLAGELDVSDRVRFHGFVPHPRLRPLVEGADLMVVSSRHEGDPVAVLEAAVAGVPTVGTPVGHLRDWAPEAAVTVPVEDDEAMAREIEALAGDDARRMDIAREAGARAVGMDADWSAREVMALYERLAGGRQVHA